MNNFFEDINRATAEYPYIKITNYDIDYVNHIHEETEIVYVLEGEIEVVVDSNNLSLHRGDICIITPGQVHNLVAVGYNKVCIMKLHNYLDLSGLKLRSNIVMSNEGIYKQIKSFADNIIEEDLNRYEGYKSAVSIASWQIQLAILRNIPHIKISNYEMKKVNNKIKLVNDVNMYLKEDFPKDISLENVAKHCGYSKYYFSHYFRDITGISFWEYYTYFRIKKAAFMLDNSDNPVTQIAEDCGFFSLRSFNRAFQKYFNCAPREYRIR